MARYKEKTGWFEEWKIIAAKIITLKSVRQRESQKEIIGKSGNVRGLTSDLYVYYM